MSGTLEHKRAATQAVKSLGLQAHLRARALVLVAADSTVGNSLRDLIQLNEDDAALKALVEEFLRGEVIGKAIVCTDNMQFGKILFTVPYISQPVYSFVHLASCLLSGLRVNKITPSSVLQLGCKIPALQRLAYFIACFWCTCYHEWSLCMLICLWCLTASNCCQCSLLASFVADWHLHISILQYSMLGFRCMTDCSY